MKAISFSVVALTVSAVAAASPALAKSKRAYSETGPLIMSGTMVPPTMARASRTPEICRPVTIKRRPSMSLLSAR